MALSCPQLGFATGVTQDVICQWSTAVREQPSTPPQLMLANTLNVVDVPT